MPSTRENKELLARFIEEVWNAGDVAACDRYIAPKYSIHHDPGDPWDGQELDLPAFRERVRLSRAPFPDQRFAIREMVGEGDAVAMTWTWSATHQGGLPEFPATGGAVRMSGATIYYFDAGRLTGHWQIVDRLGVYTQLRQAAARAGSA